MTYLIEYLGEFEFIFETVLGYVSGNQMDYFEAKKTESKISCLGTFKREKDTLFIQGTILNVCGVIAIECKKICLLREVALVTWTQISVHSSPML